MSLNRFSGGSETSNNSPDNPILWPHNWVQSTSGGHFLEMNNSKDGQRVRKLNRLVSLNDVLNLTGFALLLLSLMDAQVVLQCFGFVLL